MFVVSVFAALALETRLVVISFKVLVALFASRVAFPEEITPSVTSVNDKIKSSELVPLSEAASVAPIVQSITDSVLAPEETIET